MYLRLVRGNQLDAGQFGCRLDRFRAECDWYLHQPVGLLVFDQVLVIRRYVDCAQIW